MISTSLAGGSHSAAGRLVPMTAASGTPLVLSVLSLVVSLVVGIGAVLIEVVGFVETAFRPR